MKRWLVLWTLLLTFGLLMPQLAVAVSSDDIGLVGGTSSQVQDGTSGGFGYSLPDAETKGQPAWYKRVASLALDKIRDIPQNIDKLKKIGGAVAHWAADHVKEKVSEAIHWLIGFQKQLVKISAAVAKGIVSGVSNWWNSLSPLIRGLIKGLAVGIVIALAVFVAAVAFPALVTIVGTVALVVGTVVAVVSTTLYGYFAGDNFSWLRAFAVGISMLLIGTALGRLFATGVLTQGWRAMNGFRGFLLSGSKSAVGGLLVQVGYAYLVEHRIPTLEELVSNFILCFFLGALSQLAVEGIVATRSAAFLERFGSLRVVQAVNQVMIWLLHKSPLAKLLQRVVTSKLIQKIRFIAKPLQSLVSREMPRTALEAGQHWLKVLGGKLASMVQSLEKRLWKSPEGDETEAPEGGTS